MKPVEITYSVGKTLQIKSFEPISLHASIKAEVSPKEDLKKAFNELKEIVGQQIKKDIKLLQKKKAEAQAEAQKGFFNNIFQLKEKYPHGQCSTCGKPLAVSKKGDLYCPYSFSDAPDNPHKTKPQITPNEEKFNKSLK